MNIVYHRACLTHIMFNSCTIGDLHLFTPAHSDQGKCTLRYIFPVQINVNNHEVMSCNGSQATTC